jgi:hypothetical protein
VVVNDGSAQRSLVTSLTVTFNSAVSLDPDAFELEWQGHGLVPVQVATSVADGRTVAVLTFAGEGIVNGSLADGDYTLTVRADRVHDAAGEAPAADSVTSFFRLYGDCNGDGVVDGQDVARFLGALGTHQGDASYLSYFDYDGDGWIGLADVAQLLLRLGQRE